MAELTIVGTGFFTDENYGAWSDLANANAIDGNLCVSPSIESGGDIAYWTANASALSDGATVQSVTVTIRASATNGTGTGRLQYVALLNEGFSAVAEAAEADNVSNFTTIPTSIGNMTLTFPGMNAESVRQVRMLYAVWSTSSGNFVANLDGASLSITYTEAGTGETKRVRDEGAGTTRSIVAAVGPVNSLAYLLNAGMYDPKTEALRALIWEGNPQHMPMWKGASPQAGQFLTDDELEQNCNIVWRPRA